MKIIETERLILRTWTSEDIEPFYTMNQDPKVTKFLLGPLMLEECESFIQAQNEHFHEHNYTLFATELKESDEFIGFVGLKYRGLEFKTEFSPSTEIGWRLASQYWGKGYATEAAIAVLKYGFEKCGLDQIVSFTVPANVKSIAIMERLGMQRDGDCNFKHPNLADNHPLSEHVLYKISKL
ncbi:MAG: GNAT family N-acetyltransferase [Candidatus Jidaibacter sp.]|jgi:RimJ/RimL family protein N-acetyltransferase|nr:GNAT family N-acetyltransferase [Candidatus Jidaibacter sp.]